MQLLDMMNKTQRPMNTYMDEIEEEKSQDEILPLFQFFSQSDDQEFFELIPPNQNKAKMLHHELKSLDDIINHPKWNDQVNELLIGGMQDDKDLSTMPSFQALLKLLSSSVTQKSIESNMANGMYPKLKTFLQAIIEKIQTLDPKQYSYTDTLKPVYRPFNPVVVDLMEY